MHDGATNHVHPAVEEGLSACQAFLGQRPPSLETGWPCSPWTPTSRQTFVDVLQRQWELQHREVRRAIETCLSGEEAVELQRLKQQLLLSDASWKVERASSLKVEAATVGVTKEEATTAMNPLTVSSRTNTATLADENLESTDAATATKGWMVHFEKRLMVEWDYFRDMLSAGRVRNLMDLNHVAAGGSLQPVVQSDGYS